MNSSQKQKFKTKNMGNILNAVAIILAIIWNIGFLGYNTGGVLHILLVTAIIAVILRVINDKKNNSNNSNNYKSIKN